MPQPYRRTAYAPRQPMRVSSPSKGLALASLILGVVGLPTFGVVGVGALAGTVLGVIALVRANKEPYLYGGRGLAIAGIITNVLAVLLIPVVGFVAALFIPSYLRATVHANANQSVVFVEALNEKGGICGQGSGVIASAGAVVTHVDVIRGATTIRIYKEGKSTPAEVAHWDAAHRLVELRVEGLKDPEVPRRQSTELNSGEPVFAAGITREGELALTAGVIAEIRSPGGGTATKLDLTMDTPIAALGGGLFDVRGRLIGVAMRHTPGRDKVDFALPIAMLNALSSYPPTPPAETETPGASAAAIVQRLLTEVWDRDEAEAQSALGRMRTEGALELGHVLNDGNPTVRVRAAKALAGMGEDAAMAAPDVERAATGADITVRIWAFKTLENMGNVGALCTMAQQSDTGTRITAIQSLARARGRASYCVYELVRMLKDPDANVRVATEAALVEIGQDALPHLRNAYQNGSDRELHDAAAKVLTKIEGRPPS